MRKVTPALDQRLIQLHSQGLLNNALARQLGVSETTITLMKRRLNLGSNCERNNLGAWGEQQFCQAAREQGWDARVVSQGGNHFDVEVEGRRIEVKTASFIDGGWRCPLPKLRTATKGQTPTKLKHYDRDCDMIVLVGKGRVAGEPPFFHFRRPSASLTNFHLTPHDLVPGVRDNWEVLERLLARKAA